MRAITFEESGEFQEICHLCHFVELLIVGFVELEERNWPLESIEAVIIPHWKEPNWRGRLHDHNLVLIRKFFPNAVVSTPVEGPRVSPSEMLHIDRAMLSSGMQPHIKHSPRFNPFHWQAAIQGGQPQNPVPVVTYISRQRARRRRLHPQIHERLVGVLGGVENIIFQEVSMEDHNFDRQLEIAGRTDLLLGVHGNGLTHAMFMRPKRFLCEIFVPGMIFHSHYYAFSRAMGHEYMCLFNGEAVAPSTFHVGQRLCQTDSLDILPILGLIEQAKQELLLNKPPALPRDDNPY
jgi:hypothetical protein